MGLCLYINPSQPFPAMISLLVCKFFQTYITFDGTNVNTGNAFDPETGIFRAPRSGIYSFTFHALTQDGRATYVKLVHNGKNVGGTYRRHEGEGDENHDVNANVSFKGSWVTFINAPIC